VPRRPGAGARDLMTHSATVVTDALFHSSHVSRSRPSAQWPTGSRPTTLEDIEKVSQPARPMVALPDECAGTCRRPEVGRRRCPISSSWDPCPFDVPRTTARRTGPALFGDEVIPRFDKIPITDRADKRRSGRPPRAVVAAGLIDYSAIDPASSSVSSSGDRAMIGLA